MDDYESLSHTAWECKCHVIFCHVIFMPRHLHCKVPPQDAVRTVAPALG